MTKHYDGMPTYEELTKLDKNYEYIFNLCDFIGSGYLRLTYNEDFNGKISIDYMEGGFLHSIFLPIRTKTKIIENEFYNLNKVNYNKIVKFIKLVKEAVLENLKELEI